jgi:hypothetical protein
VKFMLMMQFPLGDWQTKSIEAWPSQDVKAHIDFLRRFNKELVETGEFVRTEGLGGPEQMKVVRAKKDGTPAITDGPFPESKELLAGYRMAMRRTLICPPQKEKPQAFCTRSGWLSGRTPEGRM